MIDTITQAKPVFINEYKPTAKPKVTMFKVEIAYVYKNVHRSTPGPPSWGTL